MPFIEVTETRALSIESILVKVLVAIIPCKNAKDCITHTTLNLPLQNYGVCTKYQPIYV